MSKKYSVKFVNGGKPFDMPEWTVAKHEDFLNEMLPYEEKVKLNILKKDDFDKIFRAKMVLKTLTEIDSKVTEKDLMSLHPDDFISLWMAVYNSGKKGIEVNTQDFQKGE